MLHDGIGTEQGGMDHVELVVHMCICGPVHIGIWCGPLHTGVAYGVIVTAAGCVTGI